MKGNKKKATLRVTDADRSCDKARLEGRKKKFTVGVLVQKGVDLEGFDKGAKTA